MVKGILKKRNIPEDMAYIAFIESGYNPKALSQAGARGLWQFMPKTARDYALQVNKNIDERLDPVKSTFAATEHFKNLIAIFGPNSFLLAMAAYNGGEGRIISSLKKINNPIENRTFWHIRPYLTQETRDYPPKIIAAAIVGKNPIPFGFPDFGTTSKEVVDVSMTTTYQPTSPKTVYADTGRKTNNAEKTRSRNNSNNREAAKLKTVFYTVRKGDRVSEIAEHFAVTVADLKKWNSIKQDKVLAGSKVRVPLREHAEIIYYTAKKGDTVSQIGTKFNISSEKIIFWNGLDRTGKITKGKMLVLYTAGKPTTLRRI